MGLEVILFTFGVNIVDEQSKEMFRQLACGFGGGYVELDDLNYES